MVASFWRIQEWRIPGLAFASGSSWALLCPIYGCLLCYAPVLGLAQFGHGATWCSFPNRVGALSVRQKRHRGPLGSTRMWSTTGTPTTETCPSPHSVNLMILLHERVWGDSYYKLQRCFRQGIWDSKTLSNLPRGAPARPSLGFSRSYRPRCLLLLVRVLRMSNRLPHKKKSHLSRKHWPFEDCKRRPMASGQDTALLGSAWPFCPKKNIHDHCWELWSSHVIHGVGHSDERYLTSQSVRWILQSRLLAPSDSLLHERW